MAEVMIDIPQAHWEAIAERQKTMQGIAAQFNLLRGEDQRHVDAVLKAAGHRPEDYAQYDLERNNGSFRLKLTEAKKQPGAPPAPAAVQQAVNGAPAVI